MGYVENLNLFPAV